MAVVEELLRTEENGAIWKIMNMAGTCIRLRLIKN